MKHFSLALIFAFAVALFACSSDSGETEETFTVYTYTGTYQESCQNMSMLFVGDGQDGFQDFGGYDSWDKFEKMRDTYGAQMGLKTHSWTKSEVKAHLLGWGFSQEKAQTRTEELFGVEHGICYARRGDLVDYLVK